MNGGAGETSGIEAEPNPVRTAPAASKGGFERIEGVSPGRSWK